VRAPPWTVSHNLSQVIALAATGRPGMAAVGQIRWAVVTGSHYVPFKPFESHGRWLVSSVLGWRGIRPLARIMAMDTLSITEAKNRFTEIADRVAAEHDHFTVTRNGRPHVMVVSVAEWDELQETLAVLSDPQTRADLAEAAEAAERGDFTTEDEMQAILNARLRRSGER
jgi:antitoxin YefM